MANAEIIQRLMKAGFTDPHETPEGDVLPPICGFCEHFKAAPADYSELSDLSDETAKYVNDILGLDTKMNPFPLVHRGRCKVFDEHVAEFNKKHHKVEPENPQKYTFSTFHPCRTYVGGQQAFEPSELAKDMYSGGYVEAHKLEIYLRQFFDESSLPGYDQDEQDYSE